LKQKTSQYPVFQYPGKPKFTSQFTGFLQNPPARATATLMESKLSGSQGQYFFWEPVNNDIPETGLSQHKKTVRFSGE